MEKEDKILLATIEDKMRQCENRYAVTNTAFLDLRQRALAENFCKAERSLVLLSEQPDGIYENPDISGSGRVRALLYGGFADAERRALVFLPEYTELAEILPPSAIAGGAAQEALYAENADLQRAANRENTGGKKRSVSAKAAKTQNAIAESIIAPRAAEITNFQNDSGAPSTYPGTDRISDRAAPPDCPFALLRVTAKSGVGARKLTHRDYLGSLMGLGIKREMTGDIIVKDSGADIIIMKEIADFLLMNYEKAGRANLKLEIADITALDTGTVNIEEKRDTVASLRLDNLVSSVFALSRGKAQEAIKAGIVFVNSSQAAKPDIQLKEGDKLVMRGRGKAVLREISGKTRKDRIYVVFDRYI